MAQFGKASAKRSKPSYFMAILGVTIVLFFVGIFGLLFLNTKKYTDVVKEDIQVKVYLRQNISPGGVDSIKTYIASQPYTKSLEYIDKETAKKRWLSDGEGDFSELLDENPLPTTIEFYLRNNFVQKDTMANIKADIESHSLQVENVKYPSKLVEKIESVVRVILIAFAVLAAIFCILSIILIDNTIRLAMYSNRFLIKTMQMVGATRWFIAKPINIRAVINGLIASGIAIALIWCVMILVESFRPEFKVLRDNKSLILLFLTIIVLGITITLVSTHRAVIKYLRMKLDDLY